MANPRPNQAPGKTAALFAAVLWAAAIATAHADASFASPSSCSGQWTSCAYAFADDTAHATASVDRTGEWGNYGHSLPAGSVIEGVTIRADFFASRSNGYLQVQVSGDGGVNYGPVHTIGGNQGNTIATQPVEPSYFIDVTNDVAWTPEKLSGASLKVRATCVKQGGGPKPLCSLDWIPVEVVYAPFDFSVSVNPTRGAGDQGGSTQTTVAVTHLQGNPQGVSLWSNCGALNITCSFDPSSGTPPYSSTLTLAATDPVTGNPTPPGTYAITIYGAGGGKTRTATYALTVEEPFDFSVSVSPDSGTVARGSAILTNVTVALLQGEPQTVGLSATCPLGANCTFFPASGLPAYGSILVIYVPGGNQTTPPGVYPVTITGIGGGLSRSALYTLTVT